MTTTVRVIACVSNGWCRVIIRPGAGLLDGGIHSDWPEQWVPIPSRRPNAEFRISGYIDGVPQVIDEASS